MIDLRSAPVPPVGPDDHVRGPAGTPEVIVYADYTCPRCAVAWERLRDAPLRLVFRHLALKARHPRAVALAQAAEAAARQDRFWEFTAAIYADQGRADDPHLWAHCETLGLDLDRFQSDRRDPVVQELVRTQVLDALRAGAIVTPTLFVGLQAHPGPPGADVVAGWAARREMPATG